MVPPFFSLSKPITSRKYGGYQTKRKLLNPPVAYRSVAAVFQLSTCILFRSPQNIRKNFFLEATTSQHSSHLSRVVVLDTGVAINANIRRLLLVPAEETRSLLGLSWHVVVVVVVGVVLLLLLSTENTAAAEEDHGEEPADESTPSETVGVATDF